MIRTTALFVTAAMLLSGCKRDEQQPPPATAAMPPAPTNRVDIPSTVRQNLGITFAKVERRSVGQTIRVPGRFEAVPTAKHEYRAPTAGRVTIVIDQYTDVQPGTPLYQLDAPRLRELQQQLADSLASEQLARAGVDSMGPLRNAHKVHEESLRHAESTWVARVDNLRELRAAGAGVGEQMAQAEASLASVRADLGEVAEKDAELDAHEAELRAELGAAASRADLLFSSIASLTGLTTADLKSPDAASTQPHWRTLSTIEVKAIAGGTVESLTATNGSWLEDFAPVLSTVDPTRVRFRSRGLQSDLGRLAPGVPVTIVPPLGGSLGAAEPLTGQLTLSPVGDPDQRTIELIVTPTTHAPWARAGVSAFLETGAAGERKELAIPLAAVARDGLASIIFRRDPKDPDKVIRMDADLGANDGRWVVINSGVREGDEVVVDGVYQLMVATSGSVQKGGHFHPDGTFHEGDE